MNADVEERAASEWQERLVDAMEVRGITGSELARQTGFSAQYINSLRAKDRGARLPLDTARRLAAALGISVEWLTTGTGARDRLSDVFPVHSGTGEAPADRYSSRAEVVALLSTTAEPEVIAALRAAAPTDPDVDPGREFWIKRARELTRDLRRIRSDPDLQPRERGAKGGHDAPPRSTFRLGRKG
jgi:transcriptional regulator with XRE-family HTH domain